MSKVFSLRLADEMIENFQNLCIKNEESHREVIENLMSLYIEWDKPM